MIKAKKTYQDRIVSALVKAYRKPGRSAAKMKRVEKILALRKDHLQKMKHEAFKKSQAFPHYQAFLKNQEVKLWIGVITRLLVCGLLPLRKVTKAIIPGAKESPESMPMKTT